jgi:hypothetical protein
MTCKTNPPPAISQAAPTTLPKVRAQANGKPGIALDQAELSQMGAIFGTDDPAEIVHAVGALATTQATCAAPMPPPEAVNLAISFLASVNPADAVERSLAVQMLAAQNAAQEMTRRALMARDPKMAELFGGLGNRFMRTFAAQIEALARHRGKGQQTIRIERVTVENGGQAIVGAVTGGTGGEKKSADQAHE